MKQQKELNIMMPLMPKSTTAWLIDNTTLTFEQIANFCGLHILEVQAIADDLTLITDDQYIKNYPNLKLYQ